MKKTFITVITLAAAMLTAGAQGAYDARLFSETNHEGTARTLAMGNAFTALGGDLGSIAINPAGSAVAGYGQMAITGSFFTSTGSAMGTPADNPLGFGNKTAQSYTRMGLPNIGVTMNFDTGRASGIKRYTFGAVVSMTDNYTDKMGVSGNHYGSSFAGALAAAAEGYSYADLDASNAYDNMPSDLVLGWKSGLINSIGTAGTSYVGATEKFIDNGDGTYDIFTAGDLEQKFGREVKGSKKDYIINFGIDISDKLYIGANIGATMMDYKSDMYLREAAVNPEDFEVDFGSAKACFNELKYSYYYDATARGAYFKIGAIYRPVDWLRLGAAFQTPTIASVSEYWGASAYTNYSNSYFNAKDSTPEGSFKYNIRMPYHANAGIAFTLAKKAVFSADYEFVDYYNMRFSAIGTDNSIFDDANEEIHQTMGAQHAVRLGVEYKPIHFLALRAGYNLTTSPELYSDGSGFHHVKASRQAASFGIGYSSVGAFFVDAAVRRLSYPAEYIYPYDDYVFDANGNPLTPEIKYCRSRWSALLTIGVRF